MKRNFRFSLLMNGWFYSAFGVLFFSGVLWLAVRFWAGENTEFDGPFATLPSRLMRLHGAAAMVSLLVLGALIPTHMQRAWGEKRNHFTAIAMVALCGLMIISGYGLYYSGGERLRLWMSNIHSFSGCVLPFVLFWHVIQGRKERPHQQRRSH